MNYSKLFTVKTAMEKKDYHKFLYIATFLKSKVMIFFMVSLSAFLALSHAYSGNQFYVKKFFIFWIVLIIIATLVIIFKLEMKFKQKIKTDKTGSFNSQETIDFYGDFLIVKSTVFEGENKVKYSQFYKVFESKDYFITYFNINKATLIRKKDVENKTIESLRSLYKKNLRKKYKRIKHF